MEDFLVDVVKQAVDRLIGVERREERNAVLAVNDNVVAAAELEQIIDKSPEVDGVESAAANNLYAVNGFVGGRAAVVAAELSDDVSGFNPALGHFMNVNFSAAGKSVLGVAPGEDENALAF